VLDEDEMKKRAAPPRRRRARRQVAGAYSDAADFVLSDVCGLPTVRHERLRTRRQGCCPDMFSTRYV
jgi:hypothetical protein